MTHVTAPDPDELLGPATVARIMGLNPKTVTRYADDGRLPCVRTPGGTRRFRRADIDALLNDQQPLVLTMSRDELQAATDMLAEVIDRAWQLPLTDEEAAPLKALLAALGGESR